MTCFDPTQRDKTTILSEPNSQLACHLNQDILRNSSYNEVKKLWFSSFEVQKLLNFFDLSLLKGNDYFFRAFIHASFLNENNDNEFKNNERLEYLGDGILNALITDNLWKTYSFQSEGNLSKLRSALVNEEILASLARSISLEDCLILGKGEARLLRQKSDSLLSDCFEAMMGAIYLVIGFEDSKQILEKVIKHFESLNQVTFYDLEKIYHFDSRSRLQELVWKERKKNLDFKRIELKEGGFKILLYIDGVKIKELEDVSYKKGVKKLCQKVLEEKLYSQNVNHEEI